MRAYFMSAYTDAPLVRQLHRLVPILGVQPTSRWAEDASGPERLDRLSRPEARALGARNDRDLREAHVGVALVRHGVGAELFSEVRAALLSEIPVLWVGPPPRAHCLPGRVNSGGVPSVPELGLALGVFADLSEAHTSDAEIRRMIWGTIERMGRNVGGGGAAQTQPAQAPRP